MLIYQRVDQRWFNNFCHGDIPELAMEVMFAMCDDTEGLDHLLRILIDEIHIFFDSFKSFKSRFLLVKCPVFIGFHRWTIHFFFEANRCQGQWTCQCGFRSWTRFRDWEGCSMVEILWTWQNITVLHNQPVISGFRWLMILRGPWRFSKRRWPVGFSCCDG